MLVSFVLTAGDVFSHDGLLSPCGSEENAFMATLMQFF